LEEYDVEIFSSKVKTVFQSIHKTRMPITAKKENRKL
jgi:hypothetical protein